MVFPASLSRFRKRFSSRNSFVRTSSFSAASHVSWSEWISKASRSFCSWESFSTHAFLSNFCVGVDAPSEEKAETVVIEDGGCEGAELGGGEDFASGLGSPASIPASSLGSEEEAGCFGAAKKEVIVALALGFFEVELATSTAFRLRGVDILEMRKLSTVWRSQLRALGFYGSKLSRRLQRVAIRETVLPRRDSKDQSAFGP